MAKVLVILAIGIAVIAAAVLVVRPGDANGHPVPIPGDTATSTVPSSTSKASKTSHACTSGVRASTATNCRLAERVLSMIAANDAIGSDASNIPITNPATGTADTAICDGLDTVTCHAADGVWMSFTTNTILAAEADKATAGTDAVVAAGGTQTTTVPASTCAANMYNAQGSCLSDPTFRALCDSLYARWQAGHSEVYGTTTDATLAIQQYGQMSCDTSYPGDGTGNR